MNANAVSRTIAATFILIGSLMRHHAAAAEGPCAGLRDRLVKAAEHAKSQGQWPEDASQYELDESSWTRVARYDRIDDAARHAPFAVSPAPETRECGANTEAEGSFNCRECLDQVFTVDGDKVAFTMGRSPETCSEAPRMQWRTRDGKSHEAALNPLYNFNVASLWCTGRFLVFGLEAAYEYGSRSQTLAFWDLETGRFGVFPHGDAHLSIRDYLPDWKQSAVSSIEGSVVIASTRTALAFSPDARKWSVVDLKARRALPDPVKEEAPPKAPPASVEAALRKAFPRAVGFTPVRAYAIDGTPVVVYRADAARTHDPDQNIWFEHAEGYGVARLKSGELHGALLGVVADQYLSVEPQNVRLRGFWNEHLVISFNSDKAQRVERFPFRND